MRVSSAQRLSPDTTPVSLACYELVNQERVLCHCFCCLDQAFGDEIRHFVPEAKDRRRLDSHQGSLGANDILQQFDIADRQSLRVAQQALGNFSPAAVRVPGNHDFVAKPIKQPHGLDAGFRVIEVRKLVAEEQYAPVGKRAILVRMDPVPQPKRNPI